MMRYTTDKKVLFGLFLIFAATLSMVVNLGIPEARGDEPLRLTLAYEMFLNHNYIQPTRLGKLYFNKPPLFMWFILLSSKIFGWNVIAVRVISIIFTLLTSLVIMFFGYKVFRDLFLGVVAGLSFITFGDILFYYGYLGEIDATFTFFVALIMFSLFLGYERNDNKFVVLAGLLTGVAFLFKGFVIYGFYGLTLIALTIYYKQYLKLFSKENIFSYVLSVVIPFVWLIQTADPINYAKMMLFEVSTRAEGTKNITKFFTHLVSFPLQNLKQTLLTNILVLFVLIRYKVNIFKHPVKALLLIILLNYLPYLLFAGGKGMYSVDTRYVVPLFPVLAVVFAYILIQPKKEWIIKAFFGLVIFSIVLRFLFGVIVFPKKEGKTGILEAIAIDIVQHVDKKDKIACSCGEFKVICFYLEKNLGAIVGYPEVYPDWKYLVTCNEFKEGKLLKKYRYKRGLIELYEREK